MAVPDALAPEAVYAAPDARLAEESKDVPRGLVVVEAALPDDCSARVGLAAVDSVAADCSVALQADDRFAPAARPDDYSAPVDSAAVDSVAADCWEQGDSVVPDWHRDARSLREDSPADSPGCCQVGQR